MDQFKKGIAITLKYLVLFIMALFILGPIYFVIVSSLKTDSEIFLSPFALPAKALFENYTYVLLDMQLWKYMLNSLYYSFASVSISLICSISAAYAITRMTWKLSKISLAILMTGLLIPMHSIILPLYLSVRSFGVSSPRIVLVLVFSAFALPKSTFIFANFLKGIPRSIEEAAVIDGANIYKIILSVILPIITPAISVVVVFDFLAVWNDLLISLIFINDKADRTLQLGIMMFKGDYVTSYNYIMTAITCAIIPTIIIYFIFQKKIISGLTSGAVKG